MWHNLYIFIYLVRCKLEQRSREGQFFLAINGVIITEYSCEIHIVIQ